MLELIMLVWGIIVLCTGKFSAGKKKVYGGKARLIGLILIAPVPLSLIAGVIVGIAGYVPKGFFGPLLFVEVGFVVTAYFIANSLGKKWADQETESATNS